MTTPVNIATFKGLSIATIKGFYESFDKETIAQLDDIYADDAVFIDPITQLNGLGEIRAHFEKLGNDLNHCRFEFTNEIVDGNDLQLIWNMHYSHPSMKKGDPLTLRGTSFIRIDPDRQKVEYHEDFYDLGAMIYQNVPFLGSIIRHVNKRLSNKT